MRVLKTHIVLSKVSQALLVGPDNLLNGLFLTDSDKPRHITSMLGLKGVGQGGGEMESFKTCNHTFLRIKTNT